MNEFSALGSSKLVPTALGAHLDLAGGGQFAVQVLETSLFRVRYRPKTAYKEPRTWAISPQSDEQAAPWHGRERDSTQGFSCPAFEWVVSSNGGMIRTADLTVSIHTEPLGLSWSNPQGELIASDRASSAYSISARTGAVKHFMQRDRLEKYYGLGDKTGPLNLHGRRLRTLGLDALGYDPERGDPLYKHWPFVLTRAASGLWYGVYYDTLAACTFDLGCEHDNYHDLYRYVEIDDGDLDYYWMVGSTPAAVLAQYVKLIGGTQLPPKWSVGFAQTAMGLADAPDAQAQISQFLDHALAQGVPISAFHYGSGYSSRGKRRYVFTWNTQKFPDPKALNAQFAQHGVALVANIKPCLLDDHPSFAQVAKAQGFVSDSNNQPVMAQFWDGVGAHLDFTQPQTIAWWQERLRSQVLDYGIQAGWNDNNEYGVLDDGALSAGFGQAIPFHRSRPLHALLMTRATYEAQLQACPGEAVFTVTRGGGPGIQRYAQTWSGDNHSDWQNLRWNIRTGLQMSLSGMFNIGHDVGGFAGAAPNPELLLRWVQACSLNPRMVMNSWNTDGSTTTPWLHSEYAHLTRAAIERRYYLLPYLWALFERACAVHLPIITPTFFAFPDDTQCYDDCDEFMVGEALLIAPVVHAGQLQRRVYLPKTPGGWFDFDSRQHYEGGAWHTVPSPLERLPVFVKAGSRIAVAAAVNGRYHHDNPVSDILVF